MALLLLDRLFRLHKATDGQFVVGGSAAVLLYVLDNGGTSEELRGIIGPDSDIDIYLNSNFKKGIELISKLKREPVGIKNHHHGTVVTEEFGKIDYTILKNLDRTTVNIHGIKFNIMSLDSLINKYEYHIRRRVNRNKIKILESINKHKYRVQENMLTRGMLPPPMNFNNGFKLSGGGFVKIRGHGRRKIRYYKNGNPYVIVGGKKKRLS